MKILKLLIRKLLPNGSNQRLFFVWLINDHLYGLNAIIRSLYCSKQLTGNYFPVSCLVYPNMKCSMNIDRTAKIQLNGILHVKPWLTKSGSAFIRIKKGAKLLLENDFSIGQNVQILLAEESQLIVGGRDNTNNTESGITSDSKILVANKIEIGSGTIIAWDCFITDSDWHSVTGTEPSSPVIIGKHIWLAHGVSVLKGAKISNGSIVGAKSTVTKQFDQPALLLVGNPAKAIKENIVWSR